MLQAVHPQTVRECRCYSADGPPLYCTSQGLAVVHVLPRRVVDVESVERTLPCSPEGFWAAPGTCDHLKTMPVPAGVVPHLWDRSTIGRSV
jgi:hypothetical protein